MLPITIYIDGLPSFNYDLAFFGLIYLGLFPTALATIMLVLLIRLKGPPFLSLVNYQVPIWAVIFGMFIFTRTFTFTIHICSNFHSYWFRYI